MYHADKSYAKQLEHYFQRMYLCNMTIDKYNGNGFVRKIKLLMYPELNKIKKHFKHIDEKR